MNEQKSDSDLPVTTPWQRMVRLLLPPVQGMAIVVILGFLLGLLSRQGWIFELASNFRFQCLQALVGLSFVFLVFSRWRWAAVTGVMMFWTASCFVDCVVAPAGTTRSGKRTYRALHLNLFLFNEQTGKVLDLIRRENPEIVLFQELTPQLFASLQSLRSEYPHVANFAREGVNGQAILSKWPIAQKDFRERKTLWNWGYLTAELQLPDGNLVVFGIHPTPPTSREMWLGRNEVLSEVGAQAATTTGPRMIIGDFNCTPYAATFQDLLSKSGTRDSRAGRGILATWPHKFPEFLRIPIDHCLVSKELQVMDRRVGEACGSDHQSIIVDFTIE